MCMPRLGGRIKIEIGAFEKASRAYLRAAPTSSTTNKSVKSVTTKTTMISKLDMIRPGLVHLDIPRRETISLYTTLHLFEEGGGHSLS